MADTPQQVEIPNRALFKASEVCDLAKVQPYVLRSWEAEFADLGIVRSGAAARVYRREDIERVLRIKHLLLVEGLTLAGVRRRLEEEAEPALEDAVPLAVESAAAVSGQARQRISDVRQGLRSLLALLGESVVTEPKVAPRRADADAAAEFSLAPPDDGAAEGGRSAVGAQKEESAKSASPRRKRSA